MCNIPTETVFLHPLTIYRFLLFLDSIAGWCARRKVHAHMPAPTASSRPWTVNSPRQRSFFHVHSPAQPSLPYTDPQYQQCRVCPTVRCHLTNVGHASTPCWLWFLLFGAIKSPLKGGAAPWWGEKGFNRRLHLFCKFARKAHLGLCGPSTSFHQSRAWLHLWLGHLLVLMMLTN